MQTANGWNSAAQDTESSGIPSRLAPLDKSRFEEAFKSYCVNRELKIDARSLSIDNRMVDLHHLHCEMFKEGGSNVVSGFLFLFAFFIANA